MKRTSSFFSSKRSGLILGAALGVSTLLAGVSFAQGSVQQWGGGLTIPNSIDNTAITIKKIFLSPTGIMQENAPIELNGIDGIVKVQWSNSLAEPSAGRIMTTNLQVGNTVKFSALNCSWQGIGTIEQPGTGNNCLLITDGDGNVSLTRDASPFLPSASEPQLWKPSTTWSNNAYYKPISGDPTNGTIKLRIGVNPTVNMDWNDAQLIVRAPIESRSEFRLRTTATTGWDLNHVYGQQNNTLQTSFNNNFASNRLEITTFSKRSTGNSSTILIDSKEPMYPTKVNLEGKMAVSQYLTVGHPTSFVPGTNDKLFVNGSTRANAYYYNSDAKYKTNVALIDNALEKISALHGYSYYNKLSEKNDIGIIAQEVEKVFPELVQTDTEWYKSVSYGNLIAPVIQAVQELAGKLEALTVSMNDLFDKYVSQQAQIDALEKRLQSLEQAK